MTTMTKTVIAFDLYGTLLSTESISRVLGDLYGEDKANAIAALARRYQLEYTWRSNSMGIYKPFSEFTRCSFRQACTESKVDLSSAQEEKIMEAYNGLDTFPEVEAALNAIAENRDVEAWVFTNGTRSMAVSSIQTSGHLAAAQQTGVLSTSRVVSVDDAALRVFKPDRRTYEHMTSVAAGSGPGPGPGAGDHVQRVWLVSSNPFDALGAMASGTMSSIWVDRSGTGWVDGLGAALDMRPTTVVRGVDEAVQEILRQGR